MEILREKLSECKPESISDYFSLDKKIESEKKKRKIKSEKNLKIALLSSFTSRGIKEVLNVKCCGLGVLPEFYIGGYNQYVQEILNENSGLYQFSPDLIIIFIDIRALLGGVYLSPYSISDNEKINLTNNKIEELQNLIKKLKEKTFAKIIFHNFETPLFSPLGILENKQSFGLMEMVETLNGKLKENYKKDSQVFIFDYNQFCSAIGKHNTIDYTMYYIGDIKLSLNYLPALCDNYLAYIKPLMGMSKKCIVLDLDNTLWGGIIGEDGIEGIRLGPEPEGKPFIEFQQYLLSLYNRGIILAVNSKNNRGEVLKVFQEHPYMILKEEHFASMHINWNDKVSNMKAIAQEINIGLDSMVFIDDDKLNREIVRGSLPDVLVVNMPESPSLYLKTLVELNDFNIVQLTEEDMRKGQLYAEKRRREEYLNTATDITEFLKGLNMVVTISEANDFSIPRISQLTLKTNQFNMTTRRYKEEQLKRFIADEKFLIKSIKVEDKFGDNGISGVLIVEKSSGKWRIDTFLLSCRVIGRCVEEAILAYLLDKSRIAGVSTLVGEFIPTKKNIPAKEFYQKNGFSLSNRNEELEIWTYNIAQEYNFPNFIEIAEDDAI